jgi:hypothetical protein
MATSTTYDGVPSAEGGNIFRGMSFWVAQRVPMRKTYVEMIEVCSGSRNVSARRLTFTRTMAVP